MMPGIRQITAHAYVGPIDALVSGRGGDALDLILDQLDDNGLAQADVELEAVIDHLSKLRPLRPSAVCQLPLVGRPAIGALIFHRNPRRVIPFTILSEVLTDDGPRWTDTLDGADYEAAAFSSREMRAITARLTGGRPDQVRLTFCGASETEVRERRVAAAQDLVIPLVGWTREHARQVFARVGIHLAGEDSPAAAEAPLSPRKAAR